MARQVTAYIALGSNLGDRSAYIDNALKLLDEKSGIEVVRSSKSYETAPLGSVDQPEFINAAAELRTDLASANLLEQLVEVENALGRERTGKWGPRTIDLDMLLYGDEIINTEKLAVPHPQMHLRSFVLRGLCELDEELKHPLLNVTMGELLSRLNGGNFAMNPDRAQLVSVAGLIGVGKTTLGEKLAQRFGAELLREPYDTNPFISREYAGQADPALYSELYFLTARTEQLHRKRLPKGKVIFSDYLFDKMPVYAEVFLSRRQRTVFDNLYGPCAQSVARPKLVIYLKDSNENCLGRIRHRNRPHEKQIDVAFLEELQSGYDAIFENWDKCPVITICKSEFDCMRDDDINSLVKQVEAYAG